LDDKTHKLLAIKTGVIMGQAPRLSDAEFMELWKTTGSATAIHRVTGGNIRTIQRRRAHLETKYGRGFIGTNEYYAAIDKEVQHRFPEEFGGSSNNDGDERPQRTKPSTVVAPAKRSTAPKKVVLSKTQVGLAKKFGLTNEQYARELMKLEA
jgi:hypothetical protein